MFRCIGIIVFLFFHEIFYYTVWIFVVALHLLHSTPRFTLYIYRTPNKIFLTYYTLLYSNWHLLRVPAAAYSQDSLENRIRTSYYGTSSSTAPPQPYSWSEIQTWKWLLQRSAYSWPLRGLHSCIPNSRKRLSTWEMLSLKFGNRNRILVTSLPIFAPPTN